MGYRDLPKKERSDPTTREHEAMHDAIGFFLLVLALVWLWGLIDSLARPDWAFQRVVQIKRSWVIVTTALGPLGASIYLFAVGDQVAHAHRDGLTPQDV